MPRWGYALFAGTVAVLAAGLALAQQPAAPADEIEEIVIADRQIHCDVSRLPEIQGTAILGGKKNEVLALENLDTNLTVYRAGTG